MAAVVKSVERIGAALSGEGLESTTVNLTKGQDHTQCTPLGLTFRYTTASAQGDPMASMGIAVELIDNAGTPAVRFTRQPLTGDGSAVQAEVSIIEWGSNVTVQQGGPTALTGTSVTAAITSVNTDRSFIVPTQRATASSSGGNWRDALLQARFNSSNQIQFERRLSGPPDWNVYWYVVTFDDGDLLTEYAEFSSGNTDQIVTHTLSNAVNLDNAFLISTYESNESSDDMRDAIWNFALTGTNEITAYRNHGVSPIASATFGVWAVRGSSSEVTTQRFATNTDGNTTINQTITSVDLDKAAIINSQNMGMSSWPINRSTNGTQVDDAVNTVRLTTATNVQLQRLAISALPGNNTNARYEVVEFELESAGPGPQIIPVGLVEETDSVFAVTPLAGGVTLPVGLVEETDTVFAVTPQTGGAPQTVPVDLITEVDSVQAVTPVAGEVTVAVGTVTETDTVLPVTPVPGAVSIPVDIVEELDQVAPVFPVVEGGPQTVLVVNVAEIDTVFPVTPRLGPEEEDIKGGIPPIRKRKRRRYILPDGRVYTDPERALYELRALLKAERAAGESGGEASTSETTPASLGEESPPPDTAPEEPVTPQMLATAVSELPELLLARPERAPSLDPQLISVLFQMIDDEEAAMLLL